MDMEVVLHPKFLKELKKLPAQQQRQFTERLDLFLEDRSHAILGIHPLHGRLAGLKSMNVSGDLRALFEEKPRMVTFYKIGTHHQLFGK